MEKLKFILIVFVSVTLASCGKKSEHAHDDAGIKYTCSMHPQIVQDKPGTCPICGMALVKMSETGNSDGSLMLSESQIKLANITTTLAHYENMGESTILNGRLAVNEDQTEVVSSRVQGRIEKLYYKEVGHQVAQGQPLYEIYSEQLLTLQQEYLVALRQLEELKEKRYESFLTASEKKLMLFGMTKEQVRHLAQQKRTDSRITFLASASGVISRIDVTEGQYVTEGGALYRIEKLDKIWVEAELYSGESSLVKVGDKVRVQISGFENDLTEGIVTFLSPEYRQGTQIISLRVVINNPKRKFLPGMQANIILSHSEKKTIAIPVDAVVRDAKSSHVWVLEENGAFKPRMVKTGLENFEKVEITEGLAENENVVITGAYLLYGELILKKGGNPMAGHHHGDVTSAQEASSQNEMKAEEPMSVDPKFTKQLGAVLDSYLKMKDALVASDAKATSTATIGVAKDLGNVDMNLLKGDAHMKWMDYLNKMQNSVKVIQDSKDIEVQRASFAQLSDALHSVIKTFNVTNLKAYYQFCPMAFDNKGAFWISREEQISNPYFGDQMLRCGETKESLK